jgi:hypothetical protein
MLLQQARARLVERLTEHQLDMLNPVVPNLARMQAALRVDEAGTLGQLGGTFELPADFAWPCAENGRPMVAWLQIDLSQVAEEVGLPPKGSLVAFLARTALPGPPDEIDCDGGWMTVLPPDTARVPTPSPEGTPTLPRHALAAELQLSIPSTGSVHVHELCSQIAAREEALWQREHELEDDELPPETGFEERFGALRDVVQPPGPTVVWLGGHTSPCQDDPLHGREDAQLVLQARAARTYGYDIMTGGMVYALRPPGAAFEDATWVGQR